MNSLGYKKKTEDKHVIIIIMEVGSSWYHNMHDVFYPRSLRSRLLFMYISIPDIMDENPARRISVTEMVKSKSITTLLQYHSELRTMILQH